MTYEEAVKKGEALDTHNFGYVVMEISDGNYDAFLSTDPHSNVQWIDRLGNIVNEVPPGTNYFPVMWVGVPLEILQAKARGYYEAIDVKSYM